MSWVNWRKVAPQIIIIILKRVLLLLRLHLLLMFSKLILKPWSIISNSNWFLLVLLQRLKLFYICCLLFCGGWIFVTWVMKFHFVTYILVFRWNESNVTVIAANVLRINFIQFCLTTILIMSKVLLLLLWRLLILLPIFI